MLSGAIEKTRLDVSYLFDNRTFRYPRFRRPESGLQIAIYALLATPVQLLPESSLCRSYCIWLQCSEKLRSFIHNHEWAMAGEPSVQSGAGHAVVSGVSQRFA